MQHTAQVLSVGPGRDRGAPEATEVEGADAAEACVNEQAKLQEEARRASECGKGNGVVSLDELAQIDSLIQSDPVGKKVPVAGAAVVRLIKRVCVRAELLVVHERAGQRTHSSRRWSTVARCSCRVPLLARLQRRATWPEARAGG